jgi:hypothetical protein
MVRLVFIKIMLFVIFLINLDRFRFLLLIIRLATESRDSVAKSISHIKFSNG